MTGLLSFARDLAKQENAIQFDSGSKTAITQSILHGWAWFLFMCKSECISEVLGTSKSANWLILKFAFLAYLGHFPMFNSSSSGRRAQTALKIFMHLL
jgi:hypothetical protein